MDDYWLNKPDICIDFCMYLCAFLHTCTHLFLVFINMNKMKVFRKKNTGIFFLGFCSICPIDCYCYCAIDLFTDWARTLSLFICKHLNSLCLHKNINYTASWSPWYYPVCLLSLGGGLREFFYSVAMETLDWNLFCILWLSWLSVENVISVTLSYFILSIISLIKVYLVLFHLHFLPLHLSLISFFLSFLISYSFFLFVPLFLCSFFYCFCFSLHSCTLTLFFFFL